MLTIDSFILAFVSQNHWSLQIVTILIGTIIVNYFVIRSLKRLEKYVQHTPSIWDKALLRAAYLPVRLIGWLIGLTLLLAVLQAQGDMKMTHSLLYHFRKLAFVVVLALFLYRLVNNVQRSLLLSRERANKKVDVASVDTISKLLRLSILIIATLVIFQVLGYSISGILAFGGMGGLAVGFAAKDLLANFFGGLMIYLDKPFKVGDWVRSPDRDIEGTVEDIGWRLTRIRTFKKRPLYIPNSLFTNIIVENPSRMSHRRINETIGIRYDDGKQMQRIVADVKMMLMTHKDIDEQQTLICNFNAFNEYSLDFFICAYTHTTDWVTFHEIKQNVLFNIFQIIEERGAEIAFPTQTLLMHNKQGDL